MGPGVGAAPVVDAVVVDAVVVDAPVVDAVVELLLQQLAALVPEDQGSLLHPLEVCRVQLC